MKHELKCVKLKRRGAEYVAKLTAGMSMSEQLTFWQQRTEVMLRRQEQQHTLEFGHTEMRSCASHRAVNMTLALMARRIIEY